MPCSNPKFAIDVGVQDNGKHRIKFLRSFDSIQYLRQGLKDMLMIMPCGHCPDCLKNYARMWQGRLMCEAQYHQKACFLTLTYKNAPKFPVKEHLRKFVKDVRNKFGSGIKFFGCGELGDHTHRAHFHLILFGVDFKEDSTDIAKRGLHVYYESPTANQLWNRGFVTISDLQIGAAGYVSQYCTKKLNTSEEENFDCFFINKDGVVFQQRTYFLIMSRGLGKQYFEDHKDTIFESDYLYFEGNRFQIPRYFLKLADKDFKSSVLAQDYKDRKRNIALSSRYNSFYSMTEEEAISYIENIQLNNVKEHSRDVY